MGTEWRSITPDEVEAFVTTDAAAFGERAPEVYLRTARETLEVDRTIVAFDAARMVATSASYTMTMSAPGGSSVPVGALSWVGVLPTHRRRGLLTEMIGRHLADARERGECFSALWASEAVIYGRFGYGTATSQMAFELSRPHARFRDPVEDPGRIELIDRETAEVVFPAVYEQTLAQRHGDLSRPPWHWVASVIELDHEVKEDRHWFHVVHSDRDGMTDGYAMYRYGEQDHDWAWGLDRKLIEVYDLVAVDPVARAALWRFLLDLDLAAVLRSYNVALDEPLRWLLADPRRFRVTAMADALWLRPTDVAAALTARSYATPGAVVIEVVDPLLPEVGGRFRLDVDDDVTVERTDGAADLTLGPAELGAVYLGGVSLATLIAAGRVTVHTPRAAALADAMFATPRAPFCSTEF